MGALPLNSLRLAGGLQVSKDLSALSRAPHPLTAASR